MHVSRHVKFDESFQVDCKCSASVTSEHHAPNTVLPPIIPTISTYDNGPLPDMHNEPMLATSPAPKPLDPAHATAIVPETTIQSNCFHIKYSSNDHTCKG